MAERRQTERKGEEWVQNARKHSSTSKEGTTNVDVIVQTVQLDKNDDECIRIVNENAELRGNDWSDDRHDDESAFGKEYIATC